MRAHDRAAMNAARADRNGTTAERRAALRLAVETYCELRDLQNNAVEDGEPAAGFGDGMRSIREQWPAAEWQQAMSEARA